MAKQIAQLLWVGTKFSRMETTCLKSFLDVGYAVDLYCYNEIEGTPAGVNLMDANEIIPESEVFLGPGAGGGSYANFADRFRYYMLYKKGGWWFDTDHVAIRVLPEPTDLLIASQWEGTKGQYATNSVLWCKPGDERMKWLAENCDRILAAGDNSRGYTDTGPVLANRLVDEFDLRGNLAPWWEFNPYPYWSVRRVAYLSNREWLIDQVRFAKQMVSQATRKEFKAGYIRKGTRAMHLFNEVWRDAGMDKGLLYHPRSIYGRFQRQHAVRAA